MRRRFIREPETNEDTPQCKHERYPRANKRFVQKSAGKVMSTAYEFRYAITNESCQGVTKDLLRAVEQN